MPPTPPVFALKNVPILLFNHSSNVNQLPLSFLPFYPWSHRPFLRASWLLLSHLWGVIFELKHSPWFCSAFSHLPCYPFFPQTLQLLWSNPLSLCELSQSCTRIHTAVHVNPLTCMLTRSLCWCSCVWCEARSILFPGRPSGVRTPAHSSPRSLALSPSSLSFFFFSSWWDDIIQGGRRMATRWKANNQKLWLCTVSM